MGVKAPRRIATPLDRAFAAKKLPARHPLGFYVCESSSQVELDYRLDVYGSGRIACDCPAGAHGRDCLHSAALRWCLDHGVMGIYATCANCRVTRVAKVGVCCHGCAWQLAAIAEQEGVAA